MPVRPAPARVLPGRSPTISCKAVIVNTLNGLDRVPHVLDKVAHVLRLDPTAAAWRIRLPYASPYVFTGFKLAVAYSFVGVIGAEFITSSRGIFASAAVVRCTSPLSSISASCVWDEARPNFAVCTSRATGRVKLPCDRYTARFRASGVQFRVKASTAFFQSSGVRCSGRDCGP